MNSKKDTVSISRTKVLKEVKSYYQKAFAKKKNFKPGDPISYAGRVFDHEELESLVEASLDFWLTSGRFTQQFERDFGKYLGLRYVNLVNSGSSANLVAFMALTSPQLGERRIKKGDEVITVACGFPTTVAPIIQYGAVPVFVDVDLNTVNLDVTRLESALTKKTKAVMAAHTLGNPFELSKVKEFCDKYKLWLIEDNCDALGSTVIVNGRQVKTGTVGDLSTFSFYPAHHMTMGEGGAVGTMNPLLNKLIQSFRDWGRDCWCAPGKDNTCGKRFSWALGTLPEGYDHKYIYSHLGYNLKATDMQAAIGCAQLKKIPAFVAARRKNWRRYFNGLKDLSDVFIFQQPTPDSDPSWFGFFMILRPEVALDRRTLVSHLEEKGIQTRQMFAGNMTRQPCFLPAPGEAPLFRISGTLDNSDTVMNRGFWLGVYPGLTDPKIDFIIKSIREEVCSVATSRT